VSTRQPASTQGTRVGLHRRRRPLAFDVRDLIAREYILSGAVATGEMLPSEHSLSTQYGVSRVTVRAALHGLREAGLISIRQGVGATVLPRTHAVVHGLDRLSSIDTFALEAGQAVADVDLDFEELAADEEASLRLAVPVRHPLLAVKRVKTIDGERAGWLIDYVPEGVISFDTVRREFAGSVLDVLLAHGELGVEYADAEHVPVVVDDGLASRLAVDPGSPALYIDTVVWTLEGRAVDWAKIWLLPEHFRFVVRRRRLFEDLAG
jgi:DNA-binding GntR family transcriptional regulator